MQEEDLEWQQPLHDHASNRNSISASRAHLMYTSRLYVFYVLLTPFIWCSGSNKVLAPPCPPQALIVLPPPCPTPLAAELAVHLNDLLNYVCQHELRGIHMRKTLFHGTAKVQRMEALCKPQTASALDGSIMQPLNIKA